MSYEITKQIRIVNRGEDWDFVFTTDEYETVNVTVTSGMSSMNSEIESISIPKDCIQHFIDALEQLK